MDIKRTDQQILKEVITGLINNPSFDATGIEVSVEDGEVFLVGFVDSWESERSAKEIAENVPGVSKVHNQLELRPTGKP